MATKPYNTATGGLVKTGFGKVYGLFCSASTSLVVEIIDGLTDNDDEADAATGTLTSAGSMVPAKHAASTITSTGAATPGVYAESVVTASTIIDGDTLTINATVYRFKTTPAQAFDVALGANDAAALDNLKLAINATGVGDGSDYFAGTTVNPDVIATDNTDTTQKVVARVIGTAANGYATTSTGGTLTWADTTLGGGTGASVAGVATQNIIIGAITYTAVTSLAETHGLTAIPYQVLWETSEAVFLDNLKVAINGGAGEGTKYGTGTVAHTYVIATTNAADSQIIVARTVGDDTFTATVNALATTTTLDNYAWEDTTLGGGTGASVTAVTTEEAEILIDDRTYTVVNELSETSGATAVVDQVLYGGSEAVMLDNLKVAINNGATEGTNYSTGTVVHATVNATTNTNTTQVVEANTAGSTGNSIVTTTTMGNHSWGAGTLENGLDANTVVVEQFQVTAGGSYPVSSSGKGLSFETGLYLRFVSGSGEVTLEYE